MTRAGRLAVGCGDDGGPGGGIGGGLEQGHVTVRAGKGCGQPERMSRSGPLTWDVRRRIGQDVRRIPGRDGL